MPEGSVGASGTLVDGTVAVKSSGDWTIVDNTIPNFSTYRFIHINIGVYSAISQAGDFNVQIMKKTNSPAVLAVTWNATNMGTISVYPSGVCRLTAKTGTYAFNYKVYGLK